MGEKAVARGSIVKRAVWRFIFCKNVVGDASEIELEF